MPEPKRVTPSHANMASKIKGTTLIKINRKISLVRIPSFSETMCLMACMR